MMDYLNKIVSDFSEKIQGRVTNPEPEHLLTVRKDADRKLLAEHRATAFYHSFTQLLFATTHVKKDINRYG